MGVIDFLRRLRRAPAPTPAPTPAPEPTPARTEWKQGPFGGVRWRDCPPGGVLVEGEDTPMRTPGIPVTARRTLAWFRHEIEEASKETGVPKELILATICTEASGGAKTREAAVRARRQEPGYVSDASTPHRVSIGPMQTLISTARDMMEDPTMPGSALLDPAVSILAGARYISHQSSKTLLEPPLVAAAYNAGGLYREDLPGNRWKLRCYPRGTGAHIDRFCRFYGDVVAVLAEEASKR